MKKQRLLSLLLAITTVIAMIPALSLPAMAADVQTQIDFPDNQTEYVADGVTYVVIRSVKQLNEALTADTAHANSYILDADLNYNGETFKKIVLDKGIFDGNGHKMYGYSLVDQDNGSGKGTGISTFGGVSASSRVTVRNLTIGTNTNRISVESSFSGSSVGAVLAYSNATHWIENVTVYATINTNTVNVGGFAGNIVGSLTMKNCKFYGSINDTGAGYVGGLIGKVNSLSLTVENCENHGAVTSTKYAGGIAGSVIGDSDVTLKTTVNYGAISNAEATGGMIGHLLLDANSTNVNIENCLNAGAVSANQSNQPKAGGIIGWHVASGSSTTIQNCLNAGTVSGTGHIGGLIGWFQAANVSVTHFANIGTVNGRWAGGLIGSNSASGELNLTSCGSITTATGITGTSKRGAIIGNQAVTTLPVASKLFGTAVKNETTTSIEKEIIETLESGVNKLRELTDAQGNKVFASYIFTSSDDGLSVEIVGISETAAVAETKFLQYKEHTKEIDGVATKLLDIRVLGVFNDTDLTKYANAGFEIVLKKDGVATHDKPIVETVTEVYSSIIANEDKGDTIKTYTAADLGATYLFAVTLTNIPTTGNFTIEVRAFANEIGATETAYDNLVVINVENGAIQ